jgi:two-component system, OmpR family, sensor kinase
VRAAADSEQRLLGRARAALTAQVAGAVTVVLAVVGTLIYCVMTNGEYTSARQDLAMAVAHADLGHPPPCIWLFEQQGGTVTASPGAPSDLPVRADLRAVATDHRTRVGQTRIGASAYVVRTEWRDGGVRQAVIDLRYQVEERHRLYGALAAAEAAGLLAALLVGQLLSRRAIAPLGEALSRQRRFVADASHELRTPLTQLHTRAQLLERRLGNDVDPAELAADVRRMVTGSRQLGEVIEDLLLSAQLRQSGERFGTVDLGTLADELAAAESARAQARTVTIEVHRDDGDHLVHGIEPALRRVITALIDNALGHTGAGGHIRVTLSRPGNGTTVELTVRDDGVGLDPRDAERLFTRFARGDHGEGRRFGLGLALVREVIDGHGGTITADGTPGAGAAFTVRLPAVRPDPAPPPKPAKPIESAEPAEVGPPSTNRS